MEGDVHDVNIDEIDEIDELGGVVEILVYEERYIGYSLALNPTWSKLFKISRNCWSVSLL